MAKPFFEYNGSPTASAFGAAPQQPQQSGDFMAQLMQMLQQPQQQTQQPLDFASLFSNLRNDPQGDANKGYIPGVDNQYSPFSNGFFKTADQRKQVEQQHLGQPGFSSQTPMQQNNALLTHPVMPPGQPNFSDPFFIARMQQNPWSGMGATAKPETPGFGTPLPGSVTAAKAAQQPLFPGRKPAFNFGGMFR